VNPFRRLGRALAPPSSEWDPAGPADPAAPPWPGGGEATRAARPVEPRSPTDDPPTDPHDWPPVTELLLGPSPLLTRAMQVPDPRNPRRPSAAGTRASTGPDRAEAAGLAAAFVVDYLSWDEEDPARRGRVLAGYLRGPGPDPSRLGWSGRGRQRAELAVPGRTSVDARGRLQVEVRVRVTPYRPVRSTGAEPAAVRIAESRPNGPGSTPDAGPDQDAGSVPAVAPAPAGRGWRSLASQWVRLRVAVVSVGDRLVVGGWAEAGVGPHAAEVPSPDADGPTGGGPASGGLAGGGVAGGGAGEDPLAEPPPPGNGTTSGRAG
jgi:hypothetical protein